VGLFPVNACQFAALFILLDDLDAPLPIVHAGPLDRYARSGMVIEASDRDQWWAVQSRSRRQ